MDNGKIFPDQQEHLQKGEDIRNEIFRNMSAEDKIILSFELRRQAKELKAAYLREIHPDWTQQQIDDKVKEIFLYART